MTRGPWSGQSYALMFSIYTVQTMRYVYTNRTMRVQCSQLNCKRIKAKTPINQHKSDLWVRSMFPNTVAWKTAEQKPPELN